MKKFYKSASLVLLVGCAFSVLTFYTYDEKSDDDFKLSFNDKYGIYALPLPPDIEFATEKVPIDDPQIYERYDRELLVNTYWQSQSLLFYKRSYRYFKIIEPILEKNNIPTDFKYLALIESGLTNVVSPVGATGFWQIMSATGKQYGLEINKEVDERYHLEKSTEVACKYLNEAYKELGTWTLAAASYNMGIHGIKKQLKRQETNSYYGLALNEETSRYLFRIMAVKELMENPQKYGFHFREKDLYKDIPFKTVEVDTAVSNLGLLAQSLGINYRILKFHNPWLRYEYLPNKHGKTYALKIPLEGHFELSPSEITKDSIIDKPINDTLLIQQSDSIRK